MATPKKTTAKKTTTKKPAAKKAPVKSRSKTTVRTTTATKKPAAKKAAPRKKAASVATKATTATTSAKKASTKRESQLQQTIYWLIFAMAVLAAGMYVIGRNDEAHYQQDQVDRILSEEKNLDQEIKNRILKDIRDGKKEKN